MTTLLIFITYLVAALVLSALLFFPVFQAVNAIWEIRPDRVFYRLAMLIAIVGFWPCLRILGINNLDSIGYSLAPARFLRICAKGLGIGVIIMLVHATLLVLLGARMPEPGELHFSDLLQAIITGSISGILVAIIEETFFRGAMYHHMRCRSHVWTTLIITSLFYAAVHFMRPSIPAGGLIVDWSSGFTMLLSMLHQYKEFADIADSFVALFFAGLFLGLVRERSGNIMLCIGIHAGWVLVIKLAGVLTEVDRQSSMNFLIGDYDGIIGWAATGILVLVTLGYWSYGRIKR